MEIGASVRGFAWSLKSMTLSEYGYRRSVSTSDVTRASDGGFQALWLRTYNQRDATMFCQKKVVLSTAIALSTAFTACAGDAAHSGTCAAQIAQLEQQIRGGAPTAPQSIEPQLHHQPTPRTVQNAESKAIADADAALQRGREPNARCKDSDRARSDSGFL